MLGVSDTSMNSTCSAMLALWGVLQNASSLGSLVSGVDLSLKLKCLASLGLLVSGGRVRGRFGHASVVRVRWYCR